MKKNELDSAYALIELMSSYGSVKIWIHYGFNVISIHITLRITSLAYLFHNPQFAEEIDPFSDQFDKERASSIDPQS